MAVSDFEDLVVWQKARSLSGAVYRLTHTAAFRRDFGLRDQIQRAAVSVMSNIAEGFERNSRREFARFLTIARGSLGEVRSQLYMARDLEYVTEEQFVQLRDRCMEVKRMLVALRRSLGS